MADIELLPRKTCCPEMLNSTLQGSTLYFMAVGGLWSLLPQLDMETYTPSLWMSSIFYVLLEARVQFFQLEMSIGIPMSSVINQKHI